MKNLSERMNEYDNKLSENDRATLAILLSNPREYAKLSSQVMAERCHISRATLLRTLRKIGLTSFSDLKLTLKEERDNICESNLDFGAVCDVYHMLTEELNRFSYQNICRMLYESDTIYIYGTGNEQKTIAEEFKRIFLSAGKCVIELFDYGEMQFLKHTFGSRDLFVTVSLSGETKEGVRILNAVIPSGIQTLSITRLQNNTISRMCGANLYVATQTVISRISYELVSGFYMLLDMLFLNYLEYVRGLRHEDRKSGE